GANWRGCSGGAAGGLEFELGSNFFLGHEISSIHSDKGRESYSPQPQITSRTSNMPTSTWAWHPDVFVSLNLFDLPVFQLQWRGAAEDGGDDPHHPLVEDDLIDLALEIHECAVGDFDAIALLEG